MSFLNDHKFFFFAFGCAAFIVTMYHCLLSIFCHPRQLDFIEQPQQATGLGEVDIRNIPTHKYITCDKSPKEECPVCLSEFEEGEDLRTLPKCLHTFHVVCIDLWLYSHPNCPTCRTDATPEIHGLLQTGTINSSSNGGATTNLVSSRMSQDLEAQYAAV